MRFQHRFESNVVILNIEGEMNSIQLRGKDNALLEPFRQQNLAGGIVNFEKIEFVDSSGIGVLVAIFTALQEQGKRLVICAPNKENQELLQMTRLTDLIPVKTSEEEALAYLAQAQDEDENDDE